MSGSVPYRQVESWLLDLPAWKSRLETLKAQMSHIPGLTQQFELAAFSRDALVYGRDLLVSPEASPFAIPEGVYPPFHGVTRRGEGEPARAEGERERA